MGRRRDVEASQKLMDEAVKKYIEDNVNPNSDGCNISNAITLSVMQHDLRDISITLAMICDKLIP